MTTAPASDLLVVVPDKDWHVLLSAVLARHESLGIRPITARIASISRGDPGVRREGVAFARGLARLYTHAILIFDHEGCGDVRRPVVIEEELRSELMTTWRERADAFVVAPELEIWLFRAYAQIGKVVGLDAAAVKARLRVLDFLRGDESKPARPKEAFRRLLFEARKGYSSAFVAEIARTASLRPEGCASESFPRFVRTLRKWFPRPEAVPPKVRAR